MAIPMAFIAAIAEMLYKREQERQQNAERMAGFARLIAENNGVLVQEMSRIVNQAFSQAKLDSCNNTLSTLSTFYKEYAVNPADNIKLNTIEQQAQFTLDILDDLDIRFSSVRTYLAVASLRINALALKSSFPEGAAEIENAKNLAAASAEYITGLRPLLISATQARVGTVRIYSIRSPGSGPTRGGGGSAASCTGVARFSLDGNDIYVKGCIAPRDAAANSHTCELAVRAKLSAAAAAAHDDKVNELVAQLPLAEMDECVSLWSSYANS